MSRWLEAILAEDWAEESLSGDQRLLVLIYERSSPGFPPLTGWSSADGWLITAPSEAQPFPTERAALEIQKDPVTGRQ